MSMLSMKNGIALLIIGLAKALNLCDQTLLGEINHIFFMEKGYGL